ncbi:MAG: hypothetical protein K6L74_16075 [Neptuniibacter sp.]
MTKPVVISAPNPRILRALNKKKITGNDLAPVDTSNTNIPSTDSLPSLPHIKKREGLIKFASGRRKLSYQLRYLFKALHLWTEEREGHKISFATVHFDLLTERKLMSAKKGSVAAYGDRLSKALQSLNNESNFFLTLEHGKSANKRLHAHILISYHPDDFEHLKDLLKKGANNTGTGIKIQHTYSLKHPAKPGTDDYVNLEEELAKGICSYDKNSKGEFVVELPVNMGAADYMSKDLAKKVVTAKKRAFYAPRSLTKISNDLWKKSYEDQKALREL